MSEADVTLIRDEDVLRRMWQQTEDFSRKKEIRAHMYRLREERLRNLYSPEPGADGKGCEFSSARDHVKSFADQSFQSMKSKEVRDAGSPPKEFSYHGQDLKELSNAGWNVESENRTTDDGHTHIKSMNANIEGRYDVDGGHGQFTAVDQHKQAITEYEDDNTKLKRNENSTSTAAHEQVVRKLDDGSHFSSTTSSSSSTSKFQQVSSKQETVPYISNDDYDNSSKKYYDDSNENRTLTKERIIKTTDYDKKIKADYEQGDLISRKVEYPDENTKVIVETRSLPDGTRVTSTRREFCAPLVQTSQSKESKSESKYSSHTSTNKQFHTTQASSKTMRETSDINKNIVDSQRHIDEFDFQTIPRRQEDISIRDSRRESDDYIQNVDKINKQTHSVTNEANRNEKIILERDNKNNENKKAEERYYTKNEEHCHNIIQNNTIKETVESKTSSHEYEKTQQSDYTQRKISNDWSPAQQAWASTLRSDTPTGHSTRASSPGSRTFKSSTSSLRSSVSPDKTYRKPISRGGSPSKIDRHSPTITSPLRSSVSPDKTYRKPTSRGSSPSKLDRPTHSSPSRTISDHRSSTHSTYSFSETKSNRNNSEERNTPRPRSPNKSAPSGKTAEKEHLRSSESPEKRPYGFDGPKSPSPYKELPSQRTKDYTPSSNVPSDSISSHSHDQKFTDKQHSRSSSPQKFNSSKKPEKSPERKFDSPQYTTDIDKDGNKLINTTPGYTKPTLTTQTKSIDSDRISPTKYSTPVYDSKEKINKTKADHYKFVDEETKVYDYEKYSSSTGEKTIQTLTELSSSPTKIKTTSAPSRKSPEKDLASSNNKTTPVTEESTHKSNSTRSSISPTRKSNTNNTSVSVDRTTTSPTQNVKSPMQGKFPSRDSSPQKTTNEKLPTNDSKFHKNVPSSGDSNIPSHKITTDRHYDTYEQSVTNDTEIKGKMTEDVSSEIIETRTVSNVKEREISPNKFDTYSKRHSPEKTYYDSKNIDNTTIETKKNEGSKSHKSRTPSPTKPLSSTSPGKSPSKDKKIRDTSDFINLEKTTEELNKAVTSKKERPRQLVTPSTSPTRQVKVDGAVSVETAPSTGQSSPTTSVSGFVYFSSPRSNTTIVTDLDTQDSIEHIEYRSSSPSKIPCKSPSPEKRPTKESLPRKSSLKKPSKDYSQVSPTEKPPSSFLVSPNEENKIINFEIKDTTKEYSGKPSDSPAKSKPPFERRETYDERCRKILGMMDTVTSETLTTTSQKIEPKDHHSPSISPCRSPLYEKYSEDKVGTSKDKTESKTTTDIVKQQKTCKTISREASPTKLPDNTEMKTTIDTAKHQKICKTPSREVSPTKLQDIITVTTNKVNTVQTNKTPLRAASPTKLQDIISVTKNNDKPKPNKSNKIPSRETSPTKLHDIISIPTDKVNTREKVNKTSEFIEDNTTNISKKSVDVKTTKTITSTDKNHVNYKSNNMNKESIGTNPYKNTLDKAPKSPKINDLQKTIESGQTCLETSKENKAISGEYTSDIHTTVDLQQYSITDVVEENTSSPRSSISPSREIKPKSITITKKSDVRKKTVTDSSQEIDFTSELITSERQKEVMDKVQNSLRKLSPDRKDRSPSPSKIMTNNAPIIKSVKDINADDTLNQEKPNKLKEQKSPNKPTSRNVSPTKKSNVTSIPSRSISPKKPLSPTERPQSPQVPKTGIQKPKEPIVSHTKKPGTMAPKTSIDAKKTTTNIAKQNNTSRISTTKISSNKATVNKNTDLDQKRIPGNKSTIRDILKKETENKVTRTASDTTLKTKKPAPQRMKSKPEIHVNDIATSNKQIGTKNKITKDTQTKLPTSKPKSATALNTSFDEDNDFTIDVQQAKSSRENSPDRICPTPLGFLEDVGTPRFPDEVSEPDDEFQKRTYRTILENESIVDDIVEICEDEELFSKKSVEEIEKDECLLSVNDKVSKFTTEIENIQKPKDSSSRFKEVEKISYSEVADSNLQKDECLLSVSQKVNKFAKGPTTPKDSKSPSRNITQEYDTKTTYQDDYTKLSVNDKANLFIETAENAKIPKTKPVQKIERPDLSNVDEDLKRDECLLSVSDKVNKFVKTSEFLKETQRIEEKEQRIREQHDKIMKKIVESADTLDANIPDTVEISCEDLQQEQPKLKPKNTTVPQSKPTHTTPSLKVTTLRGSDAVKKAKALFENIATSTRKTKETTHIKTTTPTNIQNSSHAVSQNKPLKENPKEKPTVTEEKNIIDDIHPVHEQSKHLELQDNEITDKLQHKSNKSSDAHNYLRPRSPVKSRPKSPARQVPETITTTKTTITRITSATVPPKTEPKEEKSDKPHDNVPGYQRPTKTSQLKEETKPMEEIEVSSRRGSGKFGVELRRTSIERSTVSSERRRSSVEHHQPCIEDIFDLDLLEQMLEKVVGYEQRRRIRAQIRVAKKKQETEQITKQTTIKVTKTKSPERRTINRSPERQQKSALQKTTSPDRRPKSTPHKTLSPERRHKQKLDTVENCEPKDDKPLQNGDAGEPISTEKFVRPVSPSKPVSKRTINHSKSPIRPTSPEKRRPASPTKSATQQKSSRFNEYATAYMKKVGLDEDKKISDVKTKKIPTTTEHKSQKIEIQKAVETRHTITTKTAERTSSKDIIEIVQVNGKRSPSPGKKVEHVIRKSLSPERKVHSPERQMHSPERKNVARPLTPEVKQHTADGTKKQTNKDTIIKTVYDIEKKIPQKQPQEEKPSWVTNRNLKKISSETRTYSSKKIETEKPKFRAPSPSKVISKPIDVITSSYGPGPLDADGRPLFGIKALRNGATNYQVKGTVIRQEFHSRNGGEPEGTVSVTAYSTEPEDLEKLLQDQGEKPTKLHGLAAITTTKKFGGDSGTTYSEIHNKEEQQALEQFTHSDRRVTESRTTSAVDSLDRKTQTHRLDTHDTGRKIRLDNNKSIKDTDKKHTDSDRKIKTESSDKKMERLEKRMEEKKTVRQSSVKSLTEKYIKSASETKTDRTTYPKAGLILRTNSVKDSSGAEDSRGIARSDSEQSMDSVEEVVTTTTEKGGVRTTTTTTSHSGHGRTERSFLDSTTKVTGVQDILTRMKNADIVIEEGDSNEDAEARALLNKFLGATVLMAGMQSYVTEQPRGKVVVRQETVQSSGGKVTSSRRVEELDVEQCWDERVLRQLLDECTDYEQRRLLRARIRTVMAEQEACASAVTEALAAAGESVETEEQSGEREEEEVTTVTSSVRRNSSEKTVSSSTTVKNSKVIESMARPAPKPVSPFAKFRQLEKQNSTNSPKM